MRDQGFEIRSALIRAGLEQNPGPLISCDFCSCLFEYPEGWVLNETVKLFCCPRCVDVPLAVWAGHNCALFNQRPVVVKQWFRPLYQSAFLCIKCNGLVTKVKSEFPAKKQSEFNRALRLNIQCSYCFDFRDPKPWIIPDTLTKKEVVEILLPVLVRYTRINPTRIPIETAYLYSLVRKTPTFDPPMQRRVDLIVNRYYRTVQNVKFEDGVVVFYTPSFQAKIFPKETIIVRLVANKEVGSFVMDPQETLVSQLMKFDNLNGIDEPISTLNQIANEPNISNSASNSNSSDQFQVDTKST